MKAACSLLLLTLLLTSCNSGEPQQKYADSVSSSAATGVKRLPVDSSRGGAMPVVPLDTSMPADMPVAAPARNLQPK